ncbi:MAG TPA: hypothetical protein VFD97_03730, partial [Acidimicrobiia bacterium]|nr:hypothetical protein [Acidimicrobiia bacterium]
MSKQPTEPIPRWAAMVLILVLLTLLTVVAIGARRIPSTTVDSQLPFDSQALGQIVTLMSWAMMAVVVIWLILPGGGRRRRRQAPKRGSWIASALVLIALLIVFMQLGKASPELATEEQTATVSLPDVRDTTVVSLQPRTPLPAGSPTTLLIVVGAVVMAVAALSAIGRRRDDETAATPIEGLGFTGVIDDLLAELEQSGDPRLIVIGAYARM